jgi:hypothetical protein
MDNDPEFHKEDYFTDVFRVNETDGKLYRLVPFFTLNTKYGRVDDIGEVTHLDESLLFETNPVTNLFGPMYRRTEFIHDLMVFSVGDYCDRNTLLCDTSQMIKYIKVASNLPEFNLYAEGTGINEDYTAYFEASAQKWYNLRDGITRFYYRDEGSFDTYLRSIRFASSVFDKTFDWENDMDQDFSKTRYLWEVGVRVAFSGFPVKNGCGSALIDCVSLAIPSATESSKEAWKFLKSTLSEEYQSKKKLSYNAVPISKDVFQHYVERMMVYENQEDDPAYLAGGGLGGTGLEDRITYWYPVTQQWMVDAFINLLGDITIVDEVDPNVESILIEEIAKYCEGRQTAEEAANNIKERAELYVDEQ